MASHHQPAHDSYNREQHPARPFGSALQGIHGNDPLATPPLIGRTVKPRAAGPCNVCGERRYFCDCEEDTAA